jgi:hypothetical protein
VSLFKRSIQGPTAAQLIPPRMGSSHRGRAAVTNETALRHSAVWACLRLRANLVSTMPVDLYRRVNGQQIELNKPPVLVNPGGEKVDIGEWMYSSQFDLDRGGNVVGLITQRDARNFPARIDLAALGDWTAKVKDGEITSFRIGGQKYAPTRSGTRSSTPSRASRSGCPRWPTPRGRSVSTCRSRTSRSTGSGTRRCRPRS